MFRNTRRTVLGAASLVCLLGFSPANAEPQVTASINQQGPCIACHKRNGMMLGIHSRDSLKLACTSCHGLKGAHPRKPNQLMVFHVAESSPITANQRCWRCHQPQQLAQQSWFHNVHATKVACWSCHQLHPKQDPALRGVVSDKCRQCHTAKEAHHG